MGTASILIGSLLYLGVQNQADASEINEQTKAETQGFTNNSLNSDEEDSSVNTVAAQQSSEQNTDVEKRRKLLRSLKNKIMMSKEPLKKVTIQKNFLKIKSLTKN